MQKKYGLLERNSLLLPFDLLILPDTNLLVEQILNNFGRIDVLVLNGGISQRSFAIKTPIAIDRQLMEINYFSNVALTKSVIPFFVQNKSGHVVVISSISGKFGYYLRSGYAASKHALHGFYDSLRLELFKDNIFITLVCPGKIKTDISLNAINELGDRFNKMDVAQENGMDVNRCAKEILEAINLKKHEVYIGNREIFAVWIKRFFPKILFRILLKQSIE